MCGTYYVDDEMLNEIHKICRTIDANYQKRTGDIKPSEKALIIKMDIDNELQGVQANWGYQLKIGEKKQLLINARYETIHQKPTFRNDYERHRCVVPVSGFYEWNKRKDKYRCTPADKRKMMYLAGIYTDAGSESRFTIITTGANSLIEPIHDRMPVIINEAAIKDWLHHKKIEFIDMDSINYHLREHRKLAKANFFV